MSYATIADLLDRYDWRTIGQMVSDDDRRVELSELATNDKLQAVLDDASGEIDAALMMGNRYSTTDLTGLTGFSAAKLARMTCDIAMALLFRRRPLGKAEVSDRLAETAEAHLERLRTGQHVFDVADNKAAGNPSCENISLVEYDRLGLLRDRIGNRYYPARTVPLD